MKDGRPIGLASYTRDMNAMREEFHHLIDELPEEQVGPMLALVRDSLPPHRSRADVLAIVAEVRRRMHDVTGVDEEIRRLRDDPRG